MKSKRKLLKIIRDHNHYDYATKQKAGFVFYLCIAAIVGVVILIFSSIYTQLSSTGGIFIPMILFMLALLVCLSCCIFLLVKGKYNIAIHLFMISAMLVVWCVMWIYRGNVTTRLNTVVLIVALLSLIPLFITKQKIIIPIYILANLLILIVFVYVFKNQMNLSDAILVDYIADTSIAMLFTSIVGYYIFKINQQSIENIKFENQERIKSEKKLIESESRYRTIFENAQTGIYQITPEGEILQANPALIKMLGFDSLEELSKRNLNEKKVIVKSTSNNFIDVIGKQGFVKNFESEWKKKNDETIIVRENARIVRDAEGKTLYYEGFVENITERKLAEKELEKHREHLEILVKERTEELHTSNEELLSTNEELYHQREELEAVLKNLQNTQKQLVQAEKMASLGVLASGVAHEINNPLNFIKGGIFGLEQYFDENLKEHKNEVFTLIEGINIGIERAANIVTSLNHYSRRDDSKLIECDIHTIIDNCLVMLGSQIVSRIEIEKNYTTKSYLLHGNEGKLHQAMLNILSNAVEAIDDKGIINIKTNVSKQKITIFVYDSGCGISAENMPKIFDPFFTTKEAGKGTGLGLSITFNIIEEHNGTIEVESSLGHGSTVKITLPLNKI